MAGGPSQHLLRRGLTAVLPAHALHKERRTHDFDHVLGHIVGAQGDGAAVCLQIGDARAQAPSCGDGGVKGHGSAGGAQEALFVGCHAAAVGCHQTRREKTTLLQIFRGPQAALLLYGGDFAPDLIEMD